MVGLVAHHLKSLPLLLQVIEDQLLALTTNVCDPSCEPHWLFQPLRRLGEGRVLFDEVANAYLYVELVGIGVCFGVHFEVIYHLGPVLEIGCRVQNLFLLGFFLFALLLFGFFSSFLSLLDLHLLLFFEPLLLIFAEFLLPFVLVFFLLEFSCSSLGFLFFLAFLSFLHRYVKEI